MRCSVLTRNVRWFLNAFRFPALGANIADHYTKIAISKRRLPQEAKNLAWLSLDEEE